ncbi:hypothetical protein AVEN_171956-1 [Araneus ventricosus]|uniref:Uncharacterized protein n=1 Tax=Araneus ventricosus TaxID=182803 RepID=A0A4Y2P7M4_ARAVE|nr:hypothetical protein AVEN_171956-1 [Araneus ventricosus]
MILSSSLVTNCDLEQDGDEDIKNSICQGGQLHDIILLCVHLEDKKKSAAKVRAVRRGTGHRQESGRKLSDDVCELILAAGSYRSLKPI